MSVQFGDAALNNSAVPLQAASRKVPAAAAAPVSHDTGGSFMRGLLVAVLIALPFWAVLGFALYLLL